MNLTGKTAVVTGGARGIGRAIAIRFVQSGANIVIGDVLEHEAEQSLALCNEVRQGSAKFIQTDVTQESDCQALAQFAVDSFGSLDVACNNAGIEGLNTPSADLSLEDWNRVISINLTGVWLSLKYQVKAMLTQGRGGAIVNISSIMGQVAAPGIVAYNTAKHGVIGITKSAALDYAKSGIRVNSVCPGAIETEMIERAREVNPAVVQALEQATPLGRLGHVEDIGNMVVWLCSEQANFATGQSFTVDGGYTTQ
jgi:NAD(P)-dependent dehydrogenase (short-subunit alcohol dehydrogenase family)